MENNWSCLIPPAAQQYTVLIIFIFDYFSSYFYNAN